MDILGEHPNLPLNADNWRILARHDNAPPQYVGPRAVVENCSITEGCEILGTVRNCVLGKNVRIMEGAVVEDSVLMGDTIVYENATVRYSMIDHDVKIGKGATVGKARGEAKGIAVLGEGVCVGENATVADGAIISE